MLQIISERPKWIAKRRGNIIRGKALQPNAGSELRYYAALRRLIDVMAREVYAELQKLYDKPVAQAYFAEDASMSAQAKMLMEALAYRFQKIFDIASQPMATTMAAEQAKSSAASLQVSLKQLSGGLSLKTDILTTDLKEILQSTIAENVSLIKSIPSEYFTQIKGAVYRSITTGKGEADLVPFLHNQTGTTLRRARIIARDQTRKAFSNINAERLKKLGVDEYEWIHSAGGQKPRPLHVKYGQESQKGRIFSLSNPPVIDERTQQRGKPGDLINCRCVMRPVIKFDEG